MQNTMDNKIGNDIFIFWNRYVTNSPLPWKRLSLITNEFLFCGGTSKQFPVHLEAPKAMIVLYATACQVCLNQSNRFILLSLYQIYLM